MIMDLDHTKEIKSFDELFESYEPKTFKEKVEWYWLDVENFITDPFKIISFYRSCKRFIENIFKYREFLWNDRWFDWTYIIKMLECKLENDAKCYKKYAYASDAKSRIKEIELCLMLIRRINNLDYFESYVKANQKYEGAGEYENQMIKQDIDYLFKNMAKYLRQWWD